LVEPGGGAPGAVVAFVAVNFGVGGSRMFKVSGRTDAPKVEELEGATTIDLGRFRRELEQELEPALETLRRAGGAAFITQPATDWVCDRVREHLRDHEGVHVD
jgi:hypothetical protein